MGVALLTGVYGETSGLSAHNILVVRLSRHLNSAFLLYFAVVCDLLDVGDATQLEVNNIR